MKNKLKKLSVLGLGIGILIAGGWYSQQNNSLKAMTTEEKKLAVKDSSSATKASQEVKKNRAPQFGSLGRKISSVAIYYTVTYDYVWINMNELMSKNTSEILADIESTMNLVITNSNGDTLTPKLIDATALDGENYGVLNLVYEFVGYYNSKQTTKVKLIVLPNDVFEEGDETGWESLDHSTSYGALENPINGSKIGFPYRGIMNANGPGKLIPSYSPYLGAGDSDAGFLVLDKFGKGYNFAGSRGDGNGRVATIPYIDDRPVYSASSTSTLRDLAINWNYRHAYIKDLNATGSSDGTKHFFKKNNRLKQLLIDEKSQVLYVYDLTLERNLNFGVRTSMYNLSDVAKNFSMLEITDTDYYTDYVAINAIGGSEGFYFNPPAQPNPENPEKPLEMRFALKLKKNGEWLSDYTRYKILEFDKLSSNQFGPGFSYPGDEIKDYAPDEVIIDGSGGGDISKRKDTGYSLAAPPKSIVPGEALKVGYEVYAGAELPFMGLKAAPDEVSVYNNQSDRTFSTTYDITAIPPMLDPNDSSSIVGVEKGNISMTYPDKSEEVFPFAGDNQNSARGVYDVKLDRLPNEEMGTIKKHQVEMIAIVSNDGSPTNGLPSNDYAIDVHVYNFGGKGILQTLVKGTTWTKDPADLITDPVVLPNHDVEYKFENGAPNTSELGLQWVDVRMTDKSTEPSNNPVQSKIIKVPVLVVEGPNLPTGLWVDANDIYIDKSEVVGLTSAAIKEYILNKSEAQGFDLDANTDEGVEVSVAETTLTGKPDVTVPHSAKIQAKKAGFDQPATKDIKIYLVEDPDFSNVELTVEKQAIKLGESNSYMATFTEGSIHPTKLLDVLYETTAFPEYVTPDTSTIDVLINGEKLPIPVERIEFTTDRKLKVSIPEIKAGAQVLVKYDVHTSRQTPPTSYPGEVRQSYRLSGKRIDGKPFIAEMPSNPTTFNVNPASSKIQIKYLRLENKDQQVQDPVELPEKDNGTLSDPIDFNINNYKLELVTFTKGTVTTEMQPLPTEPLKVVYGDVDTITFYYSGVFKIESAPKLFDFKIQKANVQGMKVTDPDIDKSLIITDTRFTKQTWNLKAKVDKPLTSLENTNLILPDSIKYKYNDEELILTANDTVIFNHLNSANTQNYDVTQERWSKGDGFMLDIPGGAIKGLGKYKGQITITLENAK